MVVSVLPVMMLAIFPTNESGPAVLKMLLRSIKEDEDETGRNKVRGRISLGIRGMVMWVMRSFRRLLLVNTVMDMIMANMLGKIERDKSRPSFTPSKNSL